MSYPGSMRMGEDVGAECYHRLLFHGSNKSRSSGMQRIVILFFALTMFTIALTGLLNAWRG
jgi:hypothetical protein